MRTFDFISSILVFWCWDNWAGISIMQTAAAFSTTEILPSGQRLEIRALRSTDREGMLTALARSSAQSLYRRFFTVRRHFSAAETTFFLNLDFVNHVALVAVADSNTLVNSIVSETAMP
jgi:hypothetical protein